MRRTTQRIVTFTAAAALAALFVLFAWPQCVQRLCESSIASTSGSVLLFEDMLHEALARASLGLRDRGQRYVLQPFAMVGGAWGEMSEQSVCLATHASLDHLHHLVDSVEAWSGPISVAVFAPDMEYQLAIIYIHYLRVCFPEMQQKVSFHFVYPVEWPARWEFNDPSAAPAAISCEMPARVVLQHLMALRPAQMLSEWRNELPYQQNLMRNLARSACPGKFLICPDVDMVVTATGLDRALAAFLDQPLQHNCTKCAYIVPVYEVLEDQDPPPNKTQLLQLVKMKKARPFHIRVFPNNQFLSNLERWEEIAQEERMNVSYRVKQFTFFYEPVYIASRDVPEFDERFVGFGLTRNTQAYEMFVAGWQFFVLNNAFLVHWGFQNLSSRPPWRWKQSLRNSRRFPSFLREVAVRYDRDPLNMLKKHQRGNYRLLVQASDEKKVVSKAPKAKQKRNPKVPL